MHHPVVKRQGAGLLLYLTTHCDDRTTLDDSLLVVLNEPLRQRRNNDRNRFFISPLEDRTNENSHYCLPEVHSLAMSGDQRYQRKIMQSKVFNDQIRNSYCHYVAETVGPWNLHYATTTSVAA